jgi:hypothetical protein
MPQPFQGGMTALSLQFGEITLHFRNLQGESGWALECQHSQSKLLILNDFMSLARPSNSPRIPAGFRPHRFGFRRQRRFFDEFGRARTRKSLERHLGINVFVRADQEKLRDERPRLQISALYL